MAGPLPDALRAALQGEAVRQPSLAMSAAEDERLAVLLLLRGVRQETGAPSQAAQMKNGPIKIERGIPIPVGNRQDRGFTSTLRAMRKGDSALFPTSVQSIHAIVRYIDMKGIFTMRTVAGGTRVWRTK